MKRTYAQYLPAAAVLLVALIGVLLLVLTSREMQKPPEYEFGIVLDAGSSHTSMFIYKWLANKQNGTGIVTQHDKCDANGGGISSYAGHPGGAAKSLEACLQQAVESIPEAQHRKTPLYLGATAGMRLLNITDGSESKRVLKEVGTKLKSYPFSFKGATILSGKEEGAYGWVTVNYLLENFAKYGFVERWLTPGKGTIGALDLGGASTQITFLTSADIEDKQENAMELMLYGQTYKLYTHSFLCYGQDQFLLRLLAYLITTPSVRSVVEHPCYPPNYNTSVILGKDVFNSPCTKKYKPQNIDLQKNVTLVGTGNHQRCLASVQKMFDFGNCKYSNCSFDGVFQPPATGKFMAFSAFYFSHSYINTLTGISDPRQMIEASKLVCNMSMTKMTQMTKEIEEAEKYMLNVCAVSNFIQVLLMQGYHFDNDTLPLIAFEKDAGGASVGWSLGYMLSLTSNLPKESMSVLMALQPGPWTGVLCLFIILLVLSLFYMVVVCKKSRGKQDLV